MSAGAKVIIGCRDESAGLRACEEIAVETGNTDVHCRLLDLASLASVRRFAQQFLRRKLPYSWLFLPVFLFFSLVYFLYL